MLRELPHVGTPGARPHRLCRGCTVDTLTSLFKLYSHSIGLPLAVSDGMESQLNVRTLFSTSKAQRKELDAIPDSGSALYQENLQAAIATLEECRRIADRISMFSDNESEDDIPTGDLQYPIIRAKLREGMADSHPDIF
jgi:hypothetical protein